MDILVLMLLPIIWVCAVALFAAALAVLCRMSPRSGGSNDTPPNRRIWGEAKLPERYPNKNIWG